MTVSKISTLLLLVVCALAGQLEAEITTEPNNSTVFVFPVEDPRHCGEKLKVLQVLPGKGWDNLQSKTVSNIVRFNYSKCTRTSDDMFVIPDGLTATANERKTNAHINSVIFESMEGYYPAGTKDLTLDPTLPSNVTISSSFSDQFQKVKIQQTVNDAITVRVQYQDVHYDVRFDKDFTKSLTTEFKNAVAAVADSLINNDGHLAQYYADSLVGEFGTHFVNSMSAGGMIVKEDNVKASIIENNEVIQTADLEVAAKFIFEHEFLRKNSTDDKELNTWVTKYNNATVSSSSTAYGGNAEQPFSISDWKAETDIQMAAVDLSGSSIADVLTSENFPNISSSILAEVKKEVETAVARYYLLNTHFGCTDRKSSNFVFSANKDDGTCDGPATNYTFGGLFQTCKMLFKDDDTEDYCHKSGLRRPNPVTGDLNCPKGYLPVPLFVKYVQKDSRECIQPCQGFDCGTICFSKRVDLEYKFYWCAAHQSVPANSGAAFGGLYSSKLVNPVTGGTSCPVHFTDIRIGDVHVCISVDVEQAAQYAVPFGGFFSSRTGNPLAGPKDHGWRPNQWKHRCPTGYSQHIASMDDVSGNVSYCIAAGGIQNQHFLPLVSPPYTDKPKTNTSLDSTVVFVDEVNRVIWYHQNASDSWKNATTDEELKEAGLEGLIPLLDGIPTAVIHVNGTNSSTTEVPVMNSTNTAADTNGTYTSTDPSHVNSTAPAPTSGGGLSGGAIAAIAVVTTLVLLAAIGGAAYVYSKKRSQSRPRTDSRSKLTSENNAPSDYPSSHPSHEPAAEP